MAEQLDHGQQALAVLGEKTASRRIDGRLAAEAPGPSQRRGRRMRQSRSGMISAPLLALAWASARSA
jgi:hypothetical protein